MKEGMKKSLVLCLSVALGLGITATASADAVNDKVLEMATAKKSTVPVFSDVPVDHWSYKALKRLASEGILDGFDGMFKGDRTLTRYEMAVIVSRAMEKEETANIEQQALIEKLAAEYTKELADMGLEIKKLNQKVDRVQFHGYFGTRYDNAHKLAISGLGTDPIVKRTTQLAVDTSYRVNDNLMITSSTSYNRSFKAVSADFTCLGSTQWVDYDKNNIHVRYGRWETTTGYGLMFNDKIQGIQTSFGNKLRTTLIFAHYTPVTDIEATTDTSLENALYSSDLHPALMNKSFHVIETDYALNNSTNLKASYQTKPNTTGASYGSLESTGTKFCELGFDTKLSEKWLLTGVTTKSNADSYNRAYKMQLQYGTWYPVAGKGAVTLAYYNAPANAMIIGASGGLVGDYISTMGEGFKGTVLGYHFSPIDSTLMVLFYMRGKTTAADGIGALPAGTEKNIFRAQFDILF